MRLNVLLDINERLFYSSTACVWRPVSAVLPNGSTKQLQQPVAGLEAIPCRVSIDRPDSNQQQVDQNPREVWGTLFCAPQWQLKAGDVYEVRGENSEVTSWVGSTPAYYTNSLQIKVLQRGRA